MNTHADKTQENKSQAVANESSQKQSNRASTFQVVDNRPEVVAQRKLQEIANNSSHVKQLRAFQEMMINKPQDKKEAQFQAMADNYATQERPIQKKENRTGLPDNLKSGIENLSSYSMDDVKVHYNSDKPAQLQARAYAQGTDIHLGPGQEKHLPHEAWHVVQQKQGRVRPTMQMLERSGNPAFAGKGRVNINDNVELEKEADTMGEKANRNVQFKTDSKITPTISTSNNDQIVQRIILYKGKQYDQKQLFARDNLEVSKEIEKLNPSKNFSELAALARSEKMYDAEKGLEEVKVERELCKQDVLNIEGLKNSKEVTLTERFDDYPKGATLYAPIDKAIIVVNDGQFQFVGTSGLLGCVEVMIECHTETDKGYLVAHVNSKYDTDIEEIERQLSLMIRTLGQQLNKRIDWSDFTEGSQTHKLTLVRDAKDMEQNLLINMRNILAESGATMQLVNSTSASMEITVNGANYFDNQKKAPTKPPVTDYRNDKDYPFK